MSMTAAQEKILQVAEDEGQSQVLANLWQMIEGSPMKAAGVLRALQQSSDAVTKITQEIPDAWQKLDEQCLEAEVRKAQFIEDLRKFRKETLTELTGIVDAVTQLKRSLDGVNNDDALNKVNRIIEAAEKLSRLKKDGSLDLLKKLTT